MTYVMRSDPDRVVEHKLFGELCGVNRARARFPSSILTWNTLSFSYNDNGEMISRTNSSTSITTNYTYDVFGHMLSASISGGMDVDYVVDLLGRRVMRSSSNTETGRYLYNGQYQVIGEMNPDNTVKRMFVYGSRTHVPDYYTDGTNSYQFLTDHRGSVRLIVKVSDGSVQLRRDYDEFGTITFSSGSLDQPFGFAGGVYDSETNLVQFGERDYDAETGRWTSKDPILFAGGDTNLYGYVLSDPINFIDPSGLYQVCTRPVQGLPMFDHSYIRFPEGDTISWGPESGFWGPGRNNPNDSGGTCGPNQDSTPEQDQRMRDWARQNERRFYDPIFNNCHSFVRDTIRNR